MTNTVRVSEVTTELWNLQRLPPASQLLWSPLVGGGGEERGATSMILQALSQLLSSLSQNLWKHWPHTHTYYYELKLMCYLSQAALSHLKLAWPLTAGRRYYFLLKTLIKQETHRSYFDQVEGSSGGLPSLFSVLVGNVHPSRWITSLCLTYWTKTSSYRLCTSLELGSFVACNWIRLYK